MKRTYEAAAGASRGSRPLVSVVVPAYDVEPYLGPCLDSLVAQTYHPLEIIVIDDGSHDKTGAICDEYARNHTGIRVVHKENGGLSSARNAGIARTHGAYVALVDSDDVVAPTFVSSLVRACEETGCRIAALRTAVRFDEHDVPELSDGMDGAATFGEQSVESYLLDILHHRADMGAQFRLYATDLLERERFTEGILFEDFDLVYRVLHRVDRVAVIDDPALYGYRVRGKSIIGASYSTMKLQSMVGVVERFLSGVRAWWPNADLAAQAYCFTVFRMIFAQIPRGHADEAQCWAHLKEFRRAALFDADARSADRLTAMLTYAGRVPFRVFCTAARRAGVMR